MVRRTNIIFIAKYVSIVAKIDGNLFQNLEK